MAHGPRCRRQAREAVLRDGQPVGLLLAAGGGSRIGRPKALIDFHGEPLVRRGVRLLRDGGCGEVTVVTGAAAEQVRAVVGDDARVVHNPRWVTGMGGSLRVGLVAARDAPAVVVALVDQPLVAPDAIRMLIDCWRSGAAIAAATYDGAVRHPVLFDGTVFAAARDSATGDQGARSLLREHPEWVDRLACDAVASPRDIDTADDLHALLAEPDPNPRAELDPRKEPPWN